MCIWVCVCVCVLKWCLRHCPNGTYLIFGSGWKCMIYYKVYAAWPYVGALRYMRPLALKDQIPPFCPLQSSSEFLRFRLQWWLNPPFHCLSFVCFHSPPGFVITHSLSFITAFPGPDYTISPFLSWCTGTLQIQLNLLWYCSFWPTHPSFKVERFLILPLISLLSHLSAVSGLMQ